MIIFPTDTDQSDGVSVDVEITPLPTPTPTPTPTETVIPSPTPVPTDTPLPSPSPTGVPSVPDWLAGTGIDPTWLIIGAVALVGAGVIAYALRRRGARAGSD